MYIYIFVYIYICIYLMERRDRYIYLERHDGKTR